MTAPLLTNPHSVTYFVADLIEAAQEWTKLLGISPTHADEVLVVYNVAPIKIVLHPADELSPVGTVVLYWEVGNLSEAISKLTREGGVLLRGPLVTMDGVIAQVRVGSQTTLGLFQHIYKTEP